MPRPDPGAVAGGVFLAIVGIIGGGGMMWLGASQPPQYREKGNASIFFGIVFAMICIPVGVGMALVNAK